MVCDVKDLLRNSNHLDVGKDRFRQRCQIVPLVRKTLKCPDCGTEILLSSAGRERYMQGLPNGKLLTLFRLCVHQCCGRAHAQGAASHHLCDGQERIRRLLPAEGMVSGRRCDRRARTRSHGEDHPQPHQGHPRLLEAGRRDKRLHGGLQRQGALAHQADLRLQGLQVLPAQDIRPPVNRHPQAALGGSHE